MSYGDDLLAAEAAQIRHEAETREALPDDATTWRNHCVGCGEPIGPDQRWCSRSCYQAENLDPEMTG